MKEAIEADTIFAIELIIKGLVARYGDNDNDECLDAIRSGVEKALRNFDNLWDSGIPHDIT